MSKILITGGAGFIGHHIVDWHLTNTSHELILLDRLDCSGNLNRLDEIGCRTGLFRDRVRFVYHDLRSPINNLLSRQIGPVDAVLHLAAATHVDRSIDCPMEFVMDNVVATVNILDWCRDTEVADVLYFSTDEVFGPAPIGKAYSEWDRYNSGNPYAASKAGAEEMALAYHNTYGVPVRITHTMNVIGERQHPEKFVPLCISSVLNGKKLNIHANKDRTRAGSRFYIHARDVAEAVDFVMSNGVPGEKYNIVGSRELDNLQLAALIAAEVGKPLLYDMVDFHSSRPGHDLRYALDGNKLAGMGWKPRDIEGPISDIVRWTLANKQWLI